MTLFTLQDRRAFISSRSIVQLTNVIPSSSSRSNINGHTVGLQKTNHSTASLMRNLHTPDFVSLHDSILFWLTPNNVAASVIFFSKYQISVEKRYSYHCSPFGFGSHTQQKEQSTQSKTFPPTWFGCVLVISFRESENTFTTWKEMTRTHPNQVARHLNLPNRSKQHMAVCGLSLNLGSSESRKTLEQKFIFQIGTLNPQGINERFSFN